jgi:hypothetical protein
MSLSVKVTARGRRLAKTLADQIQQIRGEQPVKRSRAWNVLGDYMERKCKQSRSRNHNACTVTAVHDADHVVRRSGSDEDSRYPDHYQHHDNGL